MAMIAMTTSSSIKVNARVMRPGSRSGTGLARSLMAPSVRRPFVRVKLRLVSCPIEKRNVRAREMHVVKPPTMGKRLLKKPRKPHTSLTTLMKLFLTALLVVASVSGAHRGMIAHYRFENDGLDAAAISFPVESDALRFRDGTLDLTEPTFPNYVDAGIPTLTYNAISIAVDINPSEFPTEISPILSCGPGYRWLDINVNGGFLEVALNNSGVRYRSTKAISVDRWQTVIVAVDWFGHQLRTWVDDERVLSIELVGDRFDVVGTSFEQSDKKVSFRN